MALKPGDQSKESPPIETKERRPGDAIEGKNQEEAANDAPADGRGSTDESGE